MNKIYTARHRGMVGPLIAHAMRLPKTIFTARTKHFISSINVGYGCGGNLTIAELEEKTKLIAMQHDTFSRNTPPSRPIGFAATAPK